MLHLNAVKRISWQQGAHGMGGAECAVEGTAPCASRSRRRRPMACSVAAEFMHVRSEEKRVNKGPEEPGLGAKSARYVVEFSEKREER